MTIIRHGQKQRIPHAKEVPFDNSTNGFISTETQPAIEELYNSAAVSASPGYSYGRSGSVNSGTWLLNDTVASNITGRNFSLYNGDLFQVSVANENANTFSIEVYEHDGVTYTLLATVSLTAQRAKVQDFSGVSITRGKELAAYVATGSCKNVVVQLICKGTVAP